MAYSYKYYLLYQHSISYRLLYIGVHLSGNFARRRSTTSQLSAQLMLESTVVNDQSRNPRKSKQKQSKLSSLLSYRILARYPSQPSLTPNSFFIAFEHRLHAPAALEAKSTVAAIRRDEKVAIFHSGLTRVIKISYLRTSVCTYVRARIYRTETHSRPYRA